MAAAGGPDADRHPGRHGDGQAVPREPGASVIAGRRTHRVLVLDGSLSMAYTPADVTRFDQAKTPGRAAGQGRAPGRRHQRRPDGRPAPGRHRRPVAEPRRGPQGDRGDHAARTAGPTWPPASTRSTACWRRRPSRQKEVVFLTDLQAASWRRPGESGDEGLKRALAQLEAQQPRSVVIDLGKSGGENRAVTDLRLDAPVVTVGRRGRRPRRRAQLRAARRPTASASG